MGDHQQGGFLANTPLQRSELDMDLQSLLQPQTWPELELRIPGENDDPIPYGEIITSSQPFAIFVSDFHMSDRGRGDDFMRGHDNGPIASVTSKTNLFAQALVFAMIRARQVGASGIDLVLNGDTVDMLEIFSGPPRGPFAHPSFYSLIAQFERIPGNTVYYIPGNHDAIFIPPPPPIIVTGAYWNPVLSTYATHGHQFDPLNAAPGGIGDQIAMATAQIEVNPGRRLIPGPFPFCLIDNIKPLNYHSLRAYLLRRVPWFYRGLFQLLLSTNLALRGVKELLDLLGPLTIEDGDLYLESEAIAISAGGPAPGLPAGATPKRVVFGHTHVPCARRPYFNTGTWSPLYSIFWPTANRRWNRAVETYLDLNPQLYIFIDPTTSSPKEEYYYYNTAAGIGPLTPPQYWTPAGIDALRRALYYD